MNRFAPVSAFEHAYGPALVHAPAPAPIPAPIRLAPHNLAQMSKLRRQLPLELKEIDALIMRTRDRDPSFDDDMTQKIEIWVKSFANSLNHENLEEICNRFIGILEDLLCDPLYLEPLDETAQLSNDGHVYSRLSIDLYKLPLNEEESIFSPFDQEKIRRWEFRNHVVVQHMVKWLRNHGRVHKPSKLEEAFEQLQGRHPPHLLNDIALKIAHIMSNHASRAHFFEEKEEKEVKEEIKVEAREEVKEQEIELSARAKLARARLRERLNRRADPYRDVREQAAVQQAQEQAEFENVQRRVEEAREGLAPFEERVDVFAREVMNRIQNGELQDREAEHRLQEMIQNLRARIQEIEQRNLELEGHLRNLGENLNPLERAIKELHLRINQKVADILKEKEKSKKKLLATIGIVGGSIFASFAFASLLQGSAFSAAIVPNAGGAKFAVSLAI